MLTNAHSGGMRGIVILEVLRQVQNQIGGQIQFQEFFDLIVGTRSVTGPRPLPVVIDVRSLRAELI